MYAYELVLGTLRNDRQPKIVISHVQIRSSGLEWGPALLRELSLSV